MNRLICFISILVLAVAIVGVASSAQATMISGPFTTTSPIPYTLTDWGPADLTFPTFDPTLGTLTKVELYLSADINTVLTVTNTSPDSSSGEANTRMKMYVQDTGGSLTSPEMTIYSDDFSYSLTGGSSTTSGLISDSGTSTKDYTTPSVLSEFTSPPGTIALQAWTYTETVLANTGGNTNASQVTQADLTGTVTYYYNPIPEPSTLALFGIGAIGLLARAWRRRRA